MGGFRRQPPPEESVGSAEGYIVNGQTRNKQDKKNKKNTKEENNMLYVYV